LPNATIIVVEPKYQTEKDKAREFYYHLEASEKMHNFTVN